MSATEPLPQPSISPAPSAAVPLFVDLDGTLVATDVTFESALLLLKQHPLQALSIPIWLLKGRAHLKHELAQRVVPDFKTLPYRREVLSRLEEAKAQGRPVILATAADERVARGVADHLKIFDAVIASDGVINRRSEEKLAAIEAYCGTGGFDYIGDSRADIPIWRAAKNSSVVNPGPRILSSFSKDRAPERISAGTSPCIKALVSAMRPHQWVKNILLFTPLVMAHRVLIVKDVVAVFVAFACFSLTAAAVYVLNDLLDLPADRRHATKRLRPFACGALPVQWGPPMILGLLTSSFALSAFLLPVQFTALLALYLVLTTIYSLFIKQRLILDVMFLAGLYTHRILAGGAAINVTVSHWLLALSIFLFLSLAWAKRYAELHALDQSEKSGRSYTPDDLSIIESLGPTSGYLAVLVFSLYIHDDATRILYHRPIFLWLICPLLLYWITRIWFFAKRGALHEDPILFALKDRVSWIAALAAGVLLFLAI
jgi:4-hydroxybenzoate polyprenyltransferase